MPNNAYRRGRRFEWDVRKLFRKAGYVAIRSAGSHGVADLIVCRKPEDGLALSMAKPITVQDMDEVLDGWLIVHDQDQILDPFLYGRRKFLARGGSQTIHMTPVQSWMLQLKSTKG